MNSPLRIFVLCAVLSLLGGCGAGTADEPPLEQRGQMRSASASTTSPSDDGYHGLIQQIYVGYFGRPADPGGLAYFGENLRQAGAPTTLPALIQAYGSNPTVRNIVDVFGNSAESRELYAGDNAVFVTAVYRNLFNRDPDPAGKAFWVNSLDKQLMTRANAALVIMAGAQNADASLVGVKTSVASAFTAALDTPLRVQGYNGNTAVAQVRSFMRGIGFDASADSVRGPIVTLTDSLGSLVAGQVTPRISAAGSNAMLLNPDGTLYLWGSGGEGAMGDGTTANRLAPAALEGRFVQIAAGSKAGYGIKGDGSLWSWGWNKFGQLGDGSTENSRVPKRIGSGFASVSASSLGHVLALKADRTLWAWGINSHGQLGNGESANVAMPTPILIGRDYVAVATGYQFSLALKADGSLWAWGENRYGQLTGSVYLNTPTRIGDGFSAIAAGGEHTLALKQDGSLWSWGSDERGQLGGGSTAYSSVPILVGTGYRAIAAGDRHSLALKLDGSLWAWGDNTDGQLGTGNADSPYLPVNTGKTFTAIAAGRDFSMGVKADGSIWTWGANESGELGTGNTASSRVPLQVKAGTGIVSGAPRTISGVVAVGDYIAGAEVTARDEDGELFTVVTAADGSYTGQVLRQVRQPVKLEAKWKLRGEEIKLASIHAENWASPVTINITPVSDLIFKTFDAIAGTNGNPSLAASLLKTIKSEVKKVYGALVPSEMDDPITDKFVPDGRSAHDLMLDRHRITYRDRGYSIADLQGRIMAEGSFEGLATGSSNDVITAAERDLAILSRNALPVGGNALRNEANANIPGAARVDAVTPASARLGQPLNVVVNGANLGGAHGLQMSLEGCATTVYPAGGTETSKTFVCTPLAAGTRAGRVYVAATMRELYAFSVVVAGPPPKITDYQPKSVLVGTRTLFTLIGSDLVAGMTFALEGCTGVQEQSGGTASQRQFSCVPTQSGTKAGTLRDVRTNTSAGSFSIIVTAPVPVVTGYSPRTATLNKFTEFVFTGTNMTAPMDFVLEGCKGYQDNGGNDTRRTFGCIPQKSGVLKGYLNNFVDGKALIELQVEVVASNQNKETLYGSWHTFYTNGKLMRTITFVDMGTWVKQITTEYNVYGDYSPNYQTIARLTDFSKAGINGEAIYSYSATIISAIGCTREKYTPKGWAGKYANDSAIDPTTRKWYAEISADNILRDFSYYSPGPATSELTIGSSCMWYSSP